MHPFRRLSVWRKAHELALRAYHASSEIRDRDFPGISSQLRRAAASIAASIAEGSGRDTATDFAHCLEIALASARELDYHLLLAADLGAIGRSRHAMLEARTDEVCRMLVGLRRQVLRTPKRRDPARAR